MSFEISSFYQFLGELDQHIYIPEKLKSNTKTKFIVSNLAAIDDVTPWNLLVQTGDADSILLNTLFRCRFINFRNCLSSGKYQKYCKECNPGPNDGKLNL